MRLLYVDDDRINTLLFEEACRHAGGMTVTCAASGAEALELAATAAPDVVVIDLHLPDTTGDRLLPALRAALGHDVPAILCTADDPAVVGAVAHAAGFATCWTKPVELPRMLADLRRLVPA